MKQWLSHTLTNHYLAAAVLRIPMCLWSLQGKLAFDGRIASVFTPQRGHFFGCFETSWGRDGKWTLAAVVVTVHPWAAVICRECVRNLILRVHTAAIAAAAAGARAWARRDDRHRRVLSFIRPVRPRSYLNFPKKSIFLSDLLTYLSSSEWGKLGTSI